MITLIAVLKTLALLMAGWYMVNLTTDEAEKRLRAGHNTDKLGKFVITRALFFLFFVVCMYL